MVSSSFPVRPAMPATILNARRQTTSSSATICSSVLTNSPFALYWLIVIIVLAGAVAVAIAPRINAKFHSILKTPTQNSVTSTPASRASKSVMIMIRLPVFNSTSFLKNFPTPKAINASARSLTNPMWPIISTGIRFNPHGPIKIPAII